ncbi:S-adenosyl-L-methionine-dependent methyltransferase [Endogone sp. FLAS-F59071]|nr:S-adenosyl-L-methionine-dependent methyltransferase [Endogone sp. FLAS-F59071]|eukprot:RUS22557.1 S-adenosyl-L-methionine-dependent methyltransferase [Endogone sp. FLAS-F59071]
MSTFSHTDFNSERYRKFRPTYNSTLYDLVYQFHTAHGGDFVDAVDVGTGTGQVAESLSEKFKNVHALDRSSTMLSNAVQKSNIHYQVALAEQLPFTDSSVDLVTSGEALHWFDQPKFFEEAKRILKPRGTLAIIGYALCNIVGNQEATDIVRDFGLNEMAPYWERKALLVENYYRDISFPFTNIQWYFSHEGLDTTSLGSVSSRPFMEENMTIDRFESYIKSWSVYATYCKIHTGAEDPVERMTRKLEQAIGVKDRGTETFTVQWPTVLVVAENDKQ